MKNSGGFHTMVFFFLQAWCLLLFVSEPSRAQNATVCNPNDLRALQGFENGLINKIQGWNLNSSCCSWTGVSCNDAGRVSKFSLANRSLKGVIFDSLADLEQLSYLNLSSNLLKGVVPSTIFKMKSLQFLDLSNNELSGPAPTDLSLPAVQVFNISYNTFNGSHPVLPGSTDLVAFDISFNLFNGTIDTAICSTSSRIQTLRFSMNSFTGDFPVGFSNCGSLMELGVDCNELTGNIADDLFDLKSLSHLYVQQNELSGRLSTRISNLSNLIELDISTNRFHGNIPDVFSGLGKLEFLLAQSNKLQGNLPLSLCDLSSLKVLSLRNNTLSGRIPLNFTALSQLISLDLGTNLFVGPIPDTISLCQELKTLNLARNYLSGELPSSFKNLVSLSYLSLSNNSFSNISSALGILQHCPRLTSLVLTKSFQGGEQIPVTSIDGFKIIEVFVIAYCDLKGVIPPWLPNLKKLKVLDLSWNHLEGRIPSWIGDFDSLFYVDLSNNSLTGEIPSSMANMKGLIFRNVSQQDNSVPDFPFFIKRNTSSSARQYNQVNSFPPSLILCSNMLDGLILPGFGKLKALHVLDLSKNQFSGVIPEELSNMVSLENLDLSYNNLSGAIPWSLTRLSFLSNLNVAHNKLVGLIPSGGQFSTFSPADFEGNPGICGVRTLTCSAETPALPVTRRQKNVGLILGIAIGAGVGTVLLVSTICFTVSRSQARRKTFDVREVADSHGIDESASSSLVLLFQSKDQKEVSICDILKTTNNFDQANIIGSGGFGLVYKATLPDGRKVAIKRLSGDYGQMEREFQAEVETLSRAQHENLVTLQGYCRIKNDRLLIYTCMENGSLDYWLHEKIDGASALDWKTRLQIARGAARGLAYLHLSCQPHIVHRDIKSSNILLDENFHAHLADFGLARLILPYDTHVTTDLVGTLGYIPPEYGQASVATFKGDVYSFGVVLLELLTGKRPVDMCKPKSSNLISWVLQMRDENKVAEVFDPFMYDKEHERELMQVLEIACLCLRETPKLRPITEELVTWLENIGSDS